MTSTAMACQFPRPKSWDAAELATRISVTPGKFYEDRDGFWHYLVAGEDFRLVRGVPNNKNKIEPLPSQDGCYTVWFRVWSDDKRTLVPGEIRHGMSPAEVRFYCLEIPMAM